MKPEPHATDAKKEPKKKLTKLTMAFMMKKLVTKEDPFMIHKIGGTFALVSFFYRYLFVWPVYGSLGLHGSTFDWITMLMHLLLSASSIQFRVPSARQPTRPTMIWHEYRLHAVLFTTKAFLVYVLASYSVECGAAIRFLLYTVMHLLVDLVTHLYGSPGQTTIRGKNQSINPMIYYMRRGYAFYQFIAYASCLTPSPRGMDMGYNTYIAIQSSAFMMTLTRKGIATWQSHFKVYSACLLLSAAYAVTSLAQDFGARYAVMWTALVAMSFFLRTCGLNKYVIWALFALAVAYLTAGAEALELKALFAVPRNAVAWRTAGRPVF